MPIASNIWQQQPTGPAAAVPGSPAQPPAQNNWDAWKANYDATGRGGSSLVQWGVGPIGGSLGPNQGHSKPDFTRPELNKRKRDIWRTQGYSQQQLDEGDYQFGRGNYAWMPFGGAQFDQQSLGPHGQSGLQMAIQRQFGHGVSGADRMDNQARFYDQLRRAGPAGQEWWDTLRRVDDDRTNNRPNALLAELFNINNAPPPRPQQQPSQNPLAAIMGLLGW